MKKRKTKRQLKYKTERGEWKKTNTYMIEFLTQTRGKGKKMDNGKIQKSIYKEEEKRRRDI